MDEQQKVKSPVVLTDYQAVPGGANLVIHVSLEMLVCMPSGTV